MKRREPLSLVERLRAEIILLQAQAAGATSLLLEVQQDCVRLKAEHVAQQASIEQLTADLMAETPHAEILRRYERLYREATAHALQMESDTTHLIERERAASQAREAALLEVARAVATEDTLAYEYDDGTDQRCTFCDGALDEHGHIVTYVEDYHEWIHAADCPVTKARALLASAGEAEDATPTAASGESEASAHETP